MGGGRGGEKEREQREGGWMVDGSTLTESTDPFFLPYFIFRPQLPFQVFQTFRPRNVFLFYFIYSTADSTRLDDSFSELEFRQPWEDFENHRQSTNFSWTCEGLQDIDLDWHFKNLLMMVKHASNVWKISDKYREIIRCFSTSPFHVELHI